MENLYGRDKDNEVFHLKHDSGLDIYVLPKRDCPRCCGIFAVRYGSIDSDFLMPGSRKSTSTPYGVAHFLEHKMYGEKHGNAFADYSRLNMLTDTYTNHTVTAFFFNSACNVREDIEALFDSIENPFFTDESIENEKIIIEQEIKLNQKDARYTVRFNLLNCLYKNFPVKEEITGPLESVSKVTKELLYECYNAFYHPLNEVFIMTGDVIPEEIYEVVDKKIASCRYGKKETPKRIYPHEPPQVNKSYMEQKLNINVPLFMIGLKDNDVGYNGNNLLKKELETSMLLRAVFGRGSTLFKKLYNEGWINNSFVSSYTGEKNYGYTMIGGESKEPCEVYNAVKEYLVNSSPDRIFSQSTFEKVKQDFLRQSPYDFASMELLGGEFVSNYMKGIYLFDYSSVINSIKYDDILKKLKSHLTDKNSAVSVVYPE